MSQLYGGQGDTDPVIRVRLTAGVAYTLLTTSTRGDGNATTADQGDYQWLIFPPAGGRVFSGRSGTASANEYPKFDEDFQEINPLICDDIDYLKLPANKCYTTDRDGKVLSMPSDLLTVLKRTGYPHFDGGRFNGWVSDNCGDITSWVSDVELDHFDGHYLGECDYRVIKRTFIARDECSGLSDYCDQYLYIRQPTMEDVVLPHYTAYLECGQSFPTIAGQVVSKYQVRKQQAIHL
ncbi:MAG: hypothetical protein IPJ74_12405 [Saprospiraceae bacterium]|nr:hypothetical protein [Saprospiraceae bacterium]